MRLEACMAQRISEPSLTYFPPVSTLPTRLPAEKEAQLGQIILDFLRQSYPSVIGVGIAGVSPVETIPAGQDGRVIMTINILIQESDTTSPQMTLPEP